MKKQIKKEKDMNIKERMELHNDSPSKMMQTFLMELITFDYTDEGVGRAAAFLYDIIT